MTKQFALKQGLGDSCAVHRNERLMRKRTRLVERAGFKSLSLVADLLSDVVGAYVASASSSLPRSADRANRLKALRLKEQLVDLLEKRDADRAEKFWQDYFRITRKILLRWRPSTRAANGEAE